MPTVEFFGIFAYLLFNDLRRSFSRLFPLAGIFQDLHVYDPADMAWTNISTVASGTPPSARYGHGFAWAGGKLYVHGGTDDSGKLEDTG